MSFEAQKRYIDPRTGRIKENILKKDAIDLPKRHRNFQSFKQSFNNVNHFEFEIAGCFVVVNIRYAYRHFIQNTYHEYRANINGALLPTIIDPILIVRETQNEQETLQFYKAFKSGNELLHIVMFKAYKEEDGKYHFKTIFKADSLAKVERMIKAIDRRTLYFKYAEGSGS